MAWKRRENGEKGMGWSRDRNALRLAGVETGRGMWEKKKTLFS